ncbi:MAG: hypothetical protein SFX73_18410 [Kofleriaceae bacterium]|nr:hypothetical protein [Kofleriaceae bacterium]
MHRHLPLLVMFLAGCSEPTTPPSQTPDASIAGDAPVDASTTATVSGSLRRTVQPMGDARGSIYVAMFDRDPVLERDAAQVVGQTVLTDADLSGEGASMTYTLSGVPVRAAKYYLVAFLDDNTSVSDPSAAGPDRGDLVSLDGLAAPRLTVANAGTMTFDVNLNTVMPF